MKNNKNKPSKKRIAQNFKRALKYFCKAFYRGENGINTVKVIIPNKSLMVQLDDNKRLIYNFKRSGEVEFTCNGTSLNVGYTMDELLHNFDNNTYSSKTEYKDFDVDKGHNKLIKLADSLNENVDAFRCIYTQFDEKLDMDSLHIEVPVGEDLPMMKLFIEYEPSTKYYSLYSQLDSPIDGLKYPKKFVQTFKKHSKLVMFLITEFSGISEAKVIDTRANFDDFINLISELSNSGDSNIVLSNLDVTKNNHMLTITCKENVIIYIEMKDNGLVETSIYENKQYLNGVTYSNFDDILVDYYSYLKSDSLGDFITKLMKRTIPIISHITPLVSDDKDIKSKFKIVFKDDITDLIIVEYSNKFIIFVGEKGDIFTNIKQVETAVENYIEFNKK